MDRPITRILASVALLSICVVTSNAAEPERKTWTVDGTEREGLVYVPDAAKKTESPLVFAFHGHGGNMNNASRVFGIHKLWPEAIAVYLQGLPTPGKLTDPEGKLRGWQSGAGAQEDRDLKFFDTVLASLKKDYKVDDKQIFSTGHSNGGGFSYLLLEKRGDQLAAVAPCAAAALRMGSGVKPKPLFHLAGENDPLVKFEWQKMTIENMRKLDGCGDGQSWGNEKGCTLYPSRTGTPVVTCIHPGGHELPKEVPALIVKFFKEQKPEAKKEESTSGKK